MRLLRFAPVCSTLCKAGLDGSFRFCQSEHAKLTRILVSPN